MTKPQPVEEATYVGARTATAAAGPSRTLVGALLGAAAVGAVWAATAWLAPPPGVHSPEGALKVDFMIQESPTTASGSVLDGVTAIEFQPAYVVVRQGPEGGRVFFPERTQRLSWSR